MGWLTVAVIVIAELAATALAIRLTARRWWDYLLIVLLTAALLGPTERHLTGDISSHLPNGLWSDGADGKDQIIYASAASTLLLPLLAAALAVDAINRAWARLTKHRSN